MSELLAIGEQILAAEQARVERDNAALAVAEVRESIPQILALLQSMASRLASAEARLAELTRVASAPRVRRPVRGADGVIQYVVDELAAEEG